MGTGASSTTTKVSRVVVEPKPCILTRRPVKIVLVRHGQSKGNIDETEYSRTPDWKVELTEQGIEEARTAGKKFAEIAGKRIFVYSSPYKRCQQTLAGLLEGAGLTEADLVAHRTEPRIREQDFGNFQDPEQMKQCKASRSKFGRFFYRFPHGESGADVYDRVSTWLESLYREMEFGRIDGDTTLLLVTHGLTLRLFLMRWFHWDVETFEETWNPSNAQIIVMERSDARMKENPHGDVSYTLTLESMDAINLPDKLRLQTPRARTWICTEVGA